MEREPTPLDVHGQIPLNYASPVEPRPASARHEGRTARLVGGAVLALAGAVMLAAGTIAEAIRRNSSSHTELVIGWGTFFIIAGTLCFAIEYVGSRRR